MRKPRKIIADPSAHFRPPEPPPPVLGSEDLTHAPSGAPEYIPLPVAQLAPGDHFSLFKELDEAFVYQLVSIESDPSINADVLTRRMKCVRASTGYIVYITRAANQIVYLQPLTDDRTELYTGMQLEVNKESGRVTSLTERADGYIDVTWIADEPMTIGTATSYRRTASFMLSAKLYRF